MHYDFVTLANANWPRVEIYIVESERVLCILPIADGCIQEAEELAELILKAFNSKA